MINFIIYEDDQYYRDLYISIILSIIGKSKYAYKIIEIGKYDKNTISRISRIDGKKIIIFDIEVPGKSGLDLARQIRNKGDWTTQMIAVTSHDQLKMSALTSRMLMLDFISKYYNLEESLKESIKIAVDILIHHKSINFQYDGELFQIPYDNILYIEKNINDRFSTIVTSSSTMRINKTLSSIEKELIDMPNFFKCHRCCIVNTDNIKTVELKDGIINFEKKSINLLARDKKNKLKDILCKGQLSK